MNAGRLARRLAKPIPGYPWIARGAAERVERFLRPEMAVLETGAGGSTIWLARRARTVVTLEHSAPWIAKIREEIECQNITNVRLIYAPDYPEKGIAVELEDGALFDLLLVDGRGRVKTIETALGRVRASGLVVLDNSDRSRYRPALKFLAAAGWERETFEAEGWTTDVWTSRRAA